MTVNYHNSNLPNLKFRVSTPRNIVNFDFKMPFRKFKSPRVWAHVPDETFGNRPYPPEAINHNLARLVRESSSKAEVLPGRSPPPDRPPRTKNTVDLVMLDCIISILLMIIVDHTTVANSGHDDYEHSSKFNYIVSQLQLFRIISYDINEAHIRI